MKIITKFTVATEQGIDALLMLTKKLALEKFDSLLKKEEIDKYITEHFNTKTLINEINSMSNQWLVVYVGDAPAGYARITTKGERPDLIDGKRAIRIADFGVLQQYMQAEVMHSLLDKCVGVCSAYEAIWINEHVKSVYIELFQQNGFVLQEKEMTALDNLPLPSIYLIR
ncbi:N-acetyltransferase [Sphingobacterium sp.]|uniref:N-acetyltransferase n=1 Tax=Sphingobacterium sp. TaxID=341027 RepID=UPI00289F1D8B|nr:N-acetyltransferase [Sphingobacterium sp.]